MISWAIAGVDLLVDVRSPRGVRAGLEGALRDAVRTGRLAPGTRLPSSRQLAADLGVARNTVAEVYTQLIAEGHLRGRAGSGTVVAPGAGQGRRESPDRSTTATGSERVGPASPPLDLRPGTPDLSLFPRAAWAGAARSVMARMPHTALGYGDPRGTVELRGALSDYVARTRGVRADPDRIIVCAGYTQAVDLLLRVMVRRRRSRVIAESPGLAFHSPDLVSGHDATLVPLPVDASGARTDLLDELGGAGPVAAVVLTPAHQFPTGAVLAADRRAAAVRWARRTDSLLVEDDYDGEFRYDRAPIGAMHGLAPEHIAYVGTASKALAPAVRLGWIVPPPDLLDELVAEKHAADHHAPTLDQLTLAELVDGGGYDRQIRRARLVYRRRRRRLAEVLAPLPGVELVGAHAGLQVLLRLPPGTTHTDELTVIDAAARRGLALAGLAEHAEPTGYRAWGPALVVGYATPPGHAVEQALRALAQVLRS